MEDKVKNFSFEPSLMSNFSIHSPLCLQIPIYGWAFQSWIHILALIPLTFRKYRSIIPISPPMRASKQGPCRSICMIVCEPPSKAPPLPKKKNHPEPANTQLMIFTIVICSPVFLCTVFYYLIKNRKPWSFHYYF